MIPVGATMLQQQDLELVSIQFAERFNYIVIFVPFFAGGMRRRQRQLSYYT